MQVQGQEAVEAIQDINDRRLLTYIQEGPHHEPDEPGIRDSGIFDINSEDTRVLVNGGLQKVVYKELD